jgi:molybdopterin-containing oxidoreductase family membrane subunit
MAMWPQFRSPLMWDVFAISTYATVSVLFWYMGMVPDLATFRDRATTRTRAIVYGIFALGWRGSARQWHRYERTYLLLAALATPLVLSVHSVVSFDFAVSQLPGWHTTIFPPYFVAGAIFSGFAMVMTLMVPARHLFGLHDIVKPSHIEAMCKIMLATGTIVGFAYATEFFIAWYSHNAVEIESFRWRLVGDYAYGFVFMALCNTLIPMLFLFRAVRRRILWLMAISLVVNFGMWWERFVIIVGGPAHGYPPHAWGLYAPSLIEYGIMIGSFCLFFFLFLLFVKHLPSVSMTEMKETVTHAG